MGKQYLMAALSGVADPDTCLLVSIDTLVGVVQSNSETGEWGSSVVFNGTHKVVVQWSAILES